MAGNSPQNSGHFRRVLVSPITYIGNSHIVKSVNTESMDKEDWPVYCLSYCTVLHWYLPVHTHKSSMPDRGLSKESLYINTFSVAWSKSSHPAREHLTGKQKDVAKCRMASKRYPTQVQTGWHTKGKLCFPPWKLKRGKSKCDCQAPSTSPYPSGKSATRRPNLQALPWHTTRHGWVKGRDGAKHDKHNYIPCKGSMRLHKSLLFQCSIAMQWQCCLQTLDNGIICHFWTFYLQYLVFSIYNIQLAAQSSASEKYSLQVEQKPSGLGIVLLHWQMYCFMLRAKLDSFPFGSCLVMRSMCHSLSFILSFSGIVTYFRNIVEDMYSLHPSENFKSGLQLWSQSKFNYGKLFSFQRHNNIHSWMFGTMILLYLLVDKSKRKYKFKCLPSYEVYCIALVTHLLTSSPRNNDSYILTWLLWGWKI